MALRETWKRFCQGFSPGVGIYLFPLAEVELCVDSCPQYVRGIKIQVRRNRTHVKSDNHTE